MPLGTAGPLNRKASNDHPGTTRYDLANTCRPVVDLTVYSIVSKIRVILFCASYER